MTKSIRVAANMALSTNENKWRKDFPFRVHVIFRWYKKRRQNNNNVMFYFDAMIESSFVEFYTFFYISHNTIRFQFNINKNQKFLTKS